MGLLSGALGGQSTSLIVTCYKYPFLKHTKIINGVAFLQLNCSITTVLQMTSLRALDKLYRRLPWCCSVWLFQHLHGRSSPTSEL